MGNSGLRVGARHAFRHFRSQHNHNWVSGNPTVEGRPTNSGEEKASNPSGSPGRTQMKIGYVCTNYNNSSFTRSAIASLVAGSRPNDVRIVVVDNKSSQEDVSMLKEIGREYPDVELLLHPENVGYFRGLNLGIAHLRSRHADVGHVVVGNNDLTFPTNFVEKVLSDRSVSNEWAAIAPDIVCSDGLHQNPHVLHPISVFRRFVWELYYLSYGAAVIIRQAARLTKRFTARPETRPGHDLHLTPGPIILGLGACYILTPVFFRHFDALYAPTFLMQEELFLTEQLKLVGQKVYYDPQFVVHHHGAATTDMLPSRLMWKFSKDAHRVYKRFFAMSGSEQRAMISRETRSTV